MNMEVCKKGKPYNSQAQEIVMNVKDFMDREAANGVPTIPLKESRKRLTEATGLSQATIYRIKKRREEGVLDTPGKKRKRKSHKTDLDDFEKAALRREVFRMYTQREIPTAGKLKVFLEDSFEYEGSERSVRRILRKMGFHWRRQNNRLLLLERVDITAARATFLRELRKNSSSNLPLPVIYLDETYLHKTETLSFLWQEKDPEPSERAACCIKSPVGKGPRLIIVHAGSKAGWVEGVHLRWRSNNSQNEDYHGDMNGERFEEWFQNMCQILEEPSYIVMDNASYHSVLLERAPATTWKKQDVQDWLDEKRIAYPPNLLKSELLAIARQHQLPKRYKLDEMALSYGHQVLRLPPYHCDLNPIELIWAQCKRYVRQNNRDFTMDAVEKLWNEAVDRVTPELWSKCVRHAEKIGDFYWEKDGIVEAEMERFIINTGSGSDSDTTEPESDED